MKNYTETAQVFEKIGGVFVSPPRQLKNKLQQIKAFVFDWDGVFNSGAKGAGTSSPFSEADSMGTNLLRYAYWVKNGSIPLTAIISGAINHTANELAVREHFSAVYLKIVDKKDALEHFCGLHHIDLQEVAYCFDDVNDFPIAKHCGARFLIRRNASPLFSQFATEHKLCDYATAHEGGNHAVREVAELILGLNGDYDKIVTSRMDFDEQYQAYFSLRQSGVVSYYEKKEQGYLLLPA